MEKKVVWSAQARKQLKELYEYILKDSVVNAEKVADDIVASTYKAARHPEIQPLDKYKKKNNGSYRAYELHRYRITYKVAAKGINIVRIRHTSRQPKMY